MSDVIRFPLRSQDVKSLHDAVTHTGYNQERFTQLR